MSGRMQNRRNYERSRSSEHIRSTPSLGGFDEINCQPIKAQIDRHPEVLRRWTVYSGARAPVQYLIDSKLFAVHK